MFCPSCGNEIKDDAQFCPKCGKQIGNANTSSINQPVQTPTKIQNDNSKGKKLILGVSIVVCVVLILILAINKIGGDKEPKKEKATQGQSVTKSVESKKGFDTYEAAIDAVFTAAYKKDVKAVSGCFPKEMDSYVQKLYNSYQDAKDSGWAGDALNYTTGSFFGFENLNLNNEYSYEIGDKVDVEQSGMLDKPSVFSKDRLKDEYGLTYDESYIVDVKSMGSYSDGTGTITNGCKGRFQVAKIDGRWYILRVDEVWLEDWKE